MLSFDSLKIIVAGDVMLDEYIGTHVRRISPEAPIPVAAIQKRWSVPGGAANVARNLARLGCEVTLVGIKGADENGKTLSRLLAEEGVQDGLLTVEDRPTTCKTRIIAQGQQLLRLDEEKNAPLSPAVSAALLAALNEAIAGAKALILSDYDKGLFRPVAGRTSLCSSIIASASANAVPVLADPKVSAWERYARVACITPNMMEFKEGAGISDETEERLEQAARKLMAQFQIPRILLTRSEKGMLLMEQDGQVFSIPAKAREVADVSGAGDTVIAVLAACIGKGMSWDKAARIANTAAGIVVEKAGTSPITLEELRQRGATG